MGDLFSIDAADGSVNWSVNTGFRVAVSPAVSREGVIYLNGPDGTLLAINPDGSEKWRFDTSGWVFSSPALDGEGNIYFGSDGNILYKLSPRGDEIWSVELTSVVSSPPVLGTNGEIYVESTDGMLHAVSSAGTVLWSYDTKDRPESLSPETPVVLSDGRIAIIKDNTTLVLLSAEGTEEWSFKTDGAAPRTPLITEAGFMHFSGGDSVLYGIALPGYTAGEPSVWGTFQGNNQRTGYQGTLVSVKDNKTETLPRDYSLEQNYPDPFNPTTQINYSLPRTVHVSLSIYDLRGQLVSKLVDETLPAGEYSLLFDAAELSSGLYFYRIITDDFIKTKKMVILK